MNLAEPAAELDGAGGVGLVRADGTKLRRYGCAPLQDAMGGGCSRISISCETTDAAVRDLVIRVLSDPTHAQQIACSSAALAKAITSLDAAKADADALGAWLGRGEISLSVLDAAMEPMEAWIGRLEAAVRKLRDTGADQAGIALGRAEVAAEWDRSDVDHRRAMVRQVAPKGFLVHPYDQSKPRASAEERLSVR